MTYKCRKVFQRYSVEREITVGDDRLFKLGINRSRDHHVPPLLRILRLSALIVGWALVLAFTGPHANAETIKITTGEWKPFISNEFKHGGVILHIVREAFARKGLDVEIAFFPWARAVKYVNDGTWDAMAVTASRHTDSSVTHIYSDAVYTGEDVLFHLRENPIPGRTFADWKGLTFGAVLSYQYTAEYRKALEAGQINQVVAPYADLLFPMLAAKRFDAFIMDKNAGLYTYNTQYREKIGDVITHQDRPLFSLEYSMRFSGKSEKSKRLVNLFNASLKEMRETGIIDQYYRDFELGAYSLP